MAMPPNAPANDTAPTAAPTSLDSIWVTPWRSPICGAALRAHHGGRDLALRADDPQSTLGPLLWHYRQEWRGRDVAMVEAGAGPARTATRLAQAEDTLRLLTADAPIDVLSLKIIGAERRSRMVPGAIRTSDGYYAIEQRITRHDVLPLGVDFDDFLRRLGHDTRRNMHRTRRKAAKGGYAFAFTPGAPREEEAAERYRLGAATHPAPRARNRLASYDRFIGARGRPFHSTIRTAAGDIVSLAAGFIAGETGFLVYQFNHVDHRQASLSLTNRSHLSEALIAQGVRELIFPNGCSGLLRQACAPWKGVEIVLIRRSFPALIKAAITWMTQTKHPVSYAVQSILPSPAELWPRRGKPLSRR
jgi:hypothetical protein